MLRAPPSWILLSIFLWNYFLVINFLGGTGSVAGQRGPPSAAAWRGASTRPEERAAPGGERGGGGGGAGAGGGPRGRRAGRGPRPRVGRGACSGRRRRKGAVAAAGQRGAGAAARGAQPRRSRLGDCVFPLLQWAAGGRLAPPAPAAARRRRFSVGARASRPLPAPLGDSGTSRPPGPAAAASSAAGRRLGPEPTRGSPRVVLPRTTRGASRVAPAARGTRVLGGQPLPAWGSAWGPQHRARPVRAPSRDRVPRAGELAGAEGARRVLRSHFLRSCRRRLPPGRGGPGPGARTWPVARVIFIGTFSGLNSLDVRCRQAGPGARRPLAVGVIRGGLPCGPGCRGPPVPLEDE